MKRLRSGGQATVRGEDAPWPASPGLSGQYASIGRVLARIRAKGAVSLAGRALSRSEAGAGGTSAETATSRRPLLEGLGSRREPPGRRGPPAKPRNRAISARAADVFGTTRDDPADPPDHHENERSPRQARAFSEIPVLIRPIHRQTAKESSDPPGRRRSRRNAARSGFRADYRRRARVNDRRSAESLRIARPRSSLTGCCSSPRFQGLTPLASRFCP